MAEKQTMLSKHNFHVAEGSSDFTDTDEIVLQVSLGPICASSLRSYSQADPSILFAAYNGRQDKMR